MFCQFFLHRDTRKFTAIMMLVRSASLSISTLPTAALRQSTFFIWNLIIDDMSRILAAISSLGATTVGNLPARFKPGPRRRGIFLMSFEEARKASYLDASFLTSFLFLLSF